MHVHTVSSMREGQEPGDQLSNLEAQVGKLLLLMCSPFSHFWNPFADQCLPCLTYSNLGDSQKQVVFIYPISKKNNLMISPSSPGLEWCTRQAGRRGAMQARALR